MFPIWTMISIVSILIYYDDDSCDYSFSIYIYFQLFKNIKMKHLFSIFIYYKNIN